MYVQFIYIYKKLRFLSVLSLGSLEDFNENSSLLMFKRGKTLAPGFGFTDLGYSKDIVSLIDAL